MPLSILRGGVYSGVLNNDIKPAVEFATAKCVYMKFDLQKLSHIFLITGLVMLTLSYFAYNFENLVLNLVMYAVLAVGFALNFIAVVTRKK